MGRSEIDRISHSLYVLKKINQLQELTRSLSDDEIADLFGIAGSLSCHKQSDLIMGVLEQLYSLNSVEIRFSKKQKPIEARRLLFFLHEIVLEMSPAAASRRFDYYTCGYRNKLMRELAQQMIVCPVYRLYVIKVTEYVTVMTRRINK